MRGLVLIAGLSLLGSLPAGSAAADDNQNPTSAEAFYSRAYAYDQKGDTDSAIADYTRALELDPEFEGALYNRANDYAKKGDNDRALEGYEAFLAINPDEAGAYLGLGFIYARKHDAARAIAECSKAISLDPNLFQPFAIRGRMYLATHDDDRAIADLTKALAINPNDSDSARVLRLAQQQRAQALQQAQDERTRQAILRALSGRTQQPPRADPPPSAASEAQDAPPQQAPGQADKQPRPAYNPADEAWREQQELDAQARDRENRDHFVAQAYIHTYSFCR